MVVEKGTEKKNPQKQLRSERRRYFTIYITYNPNNSNVFP